MGGWVGWWMDEWMDGLMDGRTDRTLTLTTARFPLPISPMSSDYI